MGEIGYNLVQIANTGFDISRLPDENEILCILLQLPNSNRVGCHMTRMALWSNVTSASSVSTPIHFINKF